MFPPLVLRDALSISKIGNWFLNIFSNSFRLSPVAKKHSSEAPPGLLAARGSSWLLAAPGSWRHLARAHTYTCTGARMHTHTCTRTGARMHMHTQRRVYVLCVLYTCMCYECMRHVFVCALCVACASRRCCVLVSCVLRVFRVLRASACVCAYLPTYLHT